MNIISYILIILLSILTTIIFVSIILYSDRKTREPSHMILICLLSGAFTIGLSLLLGQIVLPKLDIISSGLFSYNINSTIKILLLALVEEYSKLLVLYLFISKNSNFDDIYDGFVYATLISLSFAAFESLIYVLNEPNFQSMASLALLRGITTIPLHLMCGIAMGYYIGVEKFTFGTFRRIKYLILSLLIPSIMHFLYNYCLSNMIVIFKNDRMLVIIMMVIFIPFYIISICYIETIKKLNEKFSKNIKYKNLMTQKEYNKIINN